MLEAVGEVFIDRMRLTPDIDRKTLPAEIFLDKYAGRMEMTVSISFMHAQAHRFTFDVNNRIMNMTLDIQETDYIHEVYYWSPESPNLYDIEFCLEKDGVMIDHVKSYFGMRKISVAGDQVFLNNQPYYQKLVLDQGYWPESLMTPPSDQAIRHDVEMAKSMGFNGARKHRKIKDPRYYYWADRLGLLVWGEMPSAYCFNAEEIENITGELLEFLARDYNHPCIVAWVVSRMWSVSSLF